MIQGYTVHDHDGNQVGVTFAHTSKEAEFNAARWGYKGYYVELQRPETARKDVQKC
jgi:hypothetical protein